MPLLPHAAARSHTNVLLIDGDDEAAQPVKRWLQHMLPTADIAHCRSVADAQHYLGIAVVDLILSCDELPDGSGLDVLHLVREQQIAAPVVVQASVWHDTTEAALRDAGALDVAHTPDTEGRIAQLRTLFGTSPDGQSGDEPLAVASGEIGHLRGLMRALCTEVGRVTHDVNNPLTTISGNAQLLGEIGRAMELDPMLMQAIDDIAMASQQLTGELDKLTRLKQHLRQHVGHEVALPN
ncbi:MAG: histidine kinase dimerization/phospho-acceptor domain-containing protein [Bacteroidota bacterium]